jgi:hypothetical protein
MPPDTHREPGRWRRHRLFHPRAAAAVAALALLAFAAEAPPAAAADADPRARFAPLAFLAGSCWTGTLPGAKADTHCFDWRWEGRFLHDRHVVTAAGEPPYEGETLYSWDPREGRVTFTYWASDGAVTRGEAVFEEDRIVFPERYTGEDGAAIELRSVWRRSGEHGYHTTVEQRRGEAWVRLWEAEYARSGPAPGPCTG